MKVRFFTKNSKGTQSVYVRVYHGKDFDSSASTGIVLPKNEFSNPYQKIKTTSSLKNKDLINNRLLKLNEYLCDCYNETMMFDNDFQKDWLKDRINTFFNRVKTDDNYKKYLTSWAEYFNETETFNKETGLPLSPGTLKKYKSALNCFISFEEYINKKFLLKNINQEFYKTFVDYCSNVQGYTRNTTGGYVKTLKSWLKEANKKGFCNVDFTEFKVITNLTNDVYLNEKEIDIIYNHNFKENERLANTRDLLIIGVYTGLRVSDFMSLNPKNIIDNNIEILTQKTKTTVVIPLHSRVEEILKRNKGEFPRTISDQKFNEYVKEVCKEVGINEKVEGGKMNPKTKRKEFKVFEKYELISSHTCRRSFATNLYGKLDNLTIMGITGHKTEAEFLKYIKITPRQNADMLKAYWNRQKTNK